jgi:hypothetical protein
MHIIDPAYMDKLYAYFETRGREAAEARGMSDEDYSKQIEMAKSFNFELIAYGISAVCSIFFSLLIGVFVARPGNRPVKPM